MQSWPPLTPPTPAGDFCFRGVARVTESRPDHRRSHGSRRRDRKPSSEARTCPSANTTTVDPGAPEQHSRGQLPAASHAPVIQTPDPRVVPDLVSFTGEPSKGPSRFDFLVKASLHVSTSPPRCRRVVARYRRGSSSPRRPKSTRNGSYQRASVHPFGQ